MQSNFQIEGNFLINGVAFTEWFAKVIIPANEPLFPYPVNQGKLADFVNDLEKWSGKKTLSVNALIAHVCIAYNETGGKFESIREIGGMAYMFGTNGGKKRSYNTLAGNLPAGNQLKSWGVISLPADVAAWNGTTLPAASQAVYNAALNCDFYKYRGAGLNQLTGRANYKAHAAGIVKQITGKELDSLTDSELSKAFEKKEVYYGVFKSFITAAGSAVNLLENGNFYNYGLAVSGWAYYASNIFAPRCSKLVSSLATAKLENSLLLRQKKS